MFDFTLYYEYHFYIKYKKEKKKTTDFYNMLYRIVFRLFGSTSLISVLKELISAQTKRMFAFIVFNTQQLTYSLFLTLTVMCDPIRVRSILNYSKKKKYPKQNYVKIISKIAVLFQCTNLIANQHKSIDIGPFKFVRRL